MSKPLSTLLDFGCFDFECCEATHVQEGMVIVRDAPRGEFLVGWLLNDRDDTLSRRPTVGELAELGYDVTPLKQQGLKDSSVVRLKHFRALDTDGEWEKARQMILQVMRAQKRASNLIDQLSDKDIEFRTPRF